MKCCKRIVCYGDSNTWGYDARTGGGRFADDERWPRVLQSLLGDGWIVEEEGLCGRTTVFDDPLNEGVCGLRYLHTALLSHAPIDLLILMLGTNDCKSRFSATAANIADGLARLIQKAQMTDGVWRALPRILVLAPVALPPQCNSLPAAGEFGPGSVEKSQELPLLLRHRARLNGCAFLDCNGIAAVNPIDYIHLDLEGHEALANALLPKVSELFSTAEAKP